MGAVLSWKNLVEVSGAEITVSSAETGLGPRGMLTPQVQNIWRSGTWNISTTVTVSIDLKRLTPFRLVAIAAPRDGLLPPSGSTVTLTAGTLGPSGTDALNVTDSPVSLLPWGVWAWSSKTPVVARYLRLTFNYGGVIFLSSNVQLGRLWVGDGLVTTYSYAYGHGRSFRDPGLASRAGLTGVRYATRGLPYRVERIAFPLLSETEADTFMTAASEVGTTGQVFFAREEEYLGEGMFGHFAETPVINRDLEDNWTTDFQIEEDN
jgi:hypothetical protein